MTNFPISKPTALDTAQPASEAQDAPCTSGIGSSTEKPCYRDRGAVRASFPSTSISTPPDEATSGPVPRPLSRAVRLAGRMTSKGYEPENWEWFTTLTYTDSDGRHVGCDPMSIPSEVLTAAGHAPRRTKSIIRALGDEPVDPSIIRHKQLRQHCLSCATTPGQVRRCAIIDCPIWPYRMGHNPHHPQRGCNPFKTKVRNHLEVSRKT